MTLALQKLVLAVLLTTMVAFWAGLEAGRASVSQPRSNAAPATVMTSGRSAADAASPKRCHSSLGPEDFETCKAQFGE